MKIRVSAVRFRPKPPKHRNPQIESAGFFIGMVHDIEWLLNFAHLSPHILQGCGIYCIMEPQKQRAVLYPSVLIHFLEMTVKRIFLFVLTNIAVMAMISVVLRVTGLDRALGGQGGMGALLAASAVVGFAGSIISLLMSKKMAAMSVGAQIIDQPSNETEQWLVETVRRLATQANIGMPDVALYDSPDVNAFATGAFKNNALVAVSTGLLRSMNRDEAEAVLAHEITHVSNGDMVTMTLIQGVVNTFVFFLSRIIGSLVDGDREGRGGGLGYFAAVMISQIFLGFLASIIVMWFSRHREFRADAGGASLAGRQKMINALKRLQSAHEPEYTPEKVAALSISGKRGGVMRLFMTHPPLEERIARLETSVAQG